MKYSGIIFAASDSPLVRLLPDTSEIFRALTSFETVCTAHPHGGALWED